MYKTLLLMLLLQQSLLSSAQQPTDLYLLIGQSNMAGRGAVDSISKISTPAILVFNKSNNWVPATDPLHFDKKEAAVGPGLSFAKTMLESQPGKIIGLIPCAVGGTSISKWQPGAYDSATKTHPYDDAVARAKIALKTGTLKGILWHQGEGDSGGKKYQMYARRFDSLLLNLSHDLGINTTKIPIVIGELGPFYLTKYPDSHAPDLNAVLKEIPASHANIACVSTEGLTDKGDKTHFDTRSARELGKRYAEAMLQLQKQKSGKK